MLSVFTVAFLTVFVTAFGDSVSVDGDDILFPVGFSLFGAFPSGALLLLPSFDNALIALSKQPLRPIVTTHLVIE